MCDIEIEEGVGVVSGAGSAQSSLEEVEVVVVDMVSRIAEGEGVGVGAAAAHRTPAESLNSLEESGSWLEVGVLLLAVGVVIVVVVSTIEVEELLKVRGLDISPYDSVLGVGVRVGVVGAGVVLAGVVMAEALVVWVELAVVAGVPRRFVLRRISFACRISCRLRINSRRVLVLFSIVVVFATGMGVSVGGVVSAGVVAVAVCRCSAFRCRSFARRC